MGSSIETDKNGETRLVARDANGKWETSDRSGAAAPLSTPAGQQSKALDDPSYSIGGGFVKDADDDLTASIESRRQIDGGGRVLRGLDPVKWPLMKVRIAQHPDSDSLDFADDGSIVASDNDRFTKMFAAVTMRRPDEEIPKQRVQHGDIEATAYPDGSVFLDDGETDTQVGSRELSDDELAALDKLASTYRSDRREAWLRANPVPKRR